MSVKTLGELNHSEENKLTRSGRDLVPVLDVTPFSTCLQGPEDPEGLRTELWYISGICSPFLCKYIMTCCPGLLGQVRYRERRPPSMFHWSRTQTRRISLQTKLAGVEQFVVRDEGVWYRKSAFVTAKITKFSYFFYLLLHLPLFRPELPSLGAPWIILSVVTLSMS